MKRDRTLTKEPRRVKQHLKDSDLPYVPIGRKTASSTTSLLRGRKTYQATAGSRASGRDQTPGSCKQRWVIPGRPLAGAHRRRADALALCRRIKIDRLPVLVDGSRL